MSTNFSMTSDQIVTAAVRKLAVIGDGGAPTASQLANGTQALNAMIKGFIAKGMPLWAITEKTVSLSNVRNYTFSTDAPLKVTQAILVDNSSGNTTPMSPKNHYDYNLLNGNTATGWPINYWYEPLNQSGVLHLWPTPDDYSIANCQVKIVYQRPFNDMNAGTDSLDFPQYWLEAVIYGLAYRLAPEYGIPLQDRQAYAQDAQVFLNEALSFGTEEGSLYLQPDWASQ